MGLMTAQETFHKIRLTWDIPVHEASVIIIPVRHSCSTATW